MKENMRLTSDDDLHRIGRRPRPLQIVRRTPVDALVLRGDLGEEKRPVGEQLNVGRRAGVKLPPVFGPGGKLQRRRRLNVALDNARQAQRKVLTSRRVGHTGGD
ncbi:hypothetical protein TYRP_007723 [Tyrophagus putrescentiae]|nr:hypothetical protein TYRP_007723 [Tyrophagus putrescentiae]